MDFTTRYLSREGRILPGEKRLITIPAPAAGAELVAVVPGGRQWRIQGGTFVLTNSATVATRQVRLSLTDGTTEWWRAGINLAITASAVQQVSFGPTLANFAILSATQPCELPFVDAVLQPGTVLSTVTLALQAGDQYSALNMMVEECWLDDKFLSDHAYLEQEAIAAAVAAAQSQPGGQ